MSQSLDTSLEPMPVTPVSFRCGFQVGKVTGGVAQLLVVKPLTHVMQRFIAIVAVAVLAIGCRSVDVASKHSGPPPKCEVHGTEMQPEWIQVSSGEIAYMRAYLDVVKQQFPHHGGVILSGEREYRHEFERRVRDFVCSDCTRDYEAYWKEHGHK